MSSCSVHDPVQDVFWEVTTPGWCGTPFWILDLLQVQYLCWVTGQNSESSLCKGTRPKYLYYCDIWDLSRIWPSSALGRGLTHSRNSFRKLKISAVTKREGLSTAMKNKFCLVVTMTSALVWIQIYLNSRWNYFEVLIL